jgi:hypothetical protein
MPRTPRDWVARHQSRVDCSHVPASHLIDREAMLPNPFVEIGAQGQTRKRTVRGTAKPTRRKR